MQSTHAWRKLASGMPDACIFARFTRKMQAKSNSHEHAYSRSIQLKRKCGGSNTVSGSKYMSLRIPGGADEEIGQVWKPAPTNVIQWQVRIPALHAITGSKEVK